MRLPTNRHRPRARRAATSRTRPGIGHVSAARHAPPFRAAAEGRAFGRCGGALPEAAGAAVHRPGHGAGTLHTIREA